MCFSFMVLNMRSPQHITHSHELWPKTKSSNFELILQNCFSYTCLGLINRLIEFLQVKVGVDFTSIKSLSYIFDFWIFFFSIFPTFVFFTYLTFKLFILDFLTFVFFKLFFHIRIFSILMFFLEESEVKNLIFK